jgi:hypothetical protein
MGRVVSVTPLLRFSPLERIPGTHWIGWVGLRVVLDTQTREKSFASAKDRTSVVQSVLWQYTS